MDVLPPCSKKTLSWCQRLVNTGAETPVVPGWQGCTQPIKTVQQIQLRPQGQLDLLHNRLVKWEHLLVAWLPSSFRADHGASLGCALSGSGIDECLRRMMLSLSYLLLIWGFLFAPHFGHIWSLHTQGQWVPFLSSFYRWGNGRQEGLHYVISICKWLQTQAVGLWMLYSDLLCSPASHGSL